MPSKTKKQHKAMCACAHNKDVAKKMDIPQSVCKEFCKADTQKSKKK